MQAMEVSCADSGCEVSLGLAGLPGLPPLLGGAPAAVPVTPLPTWGAAGGLGGLGGLGSWGAYSEPSLPPLLAHDADLSPAIPLSPAQVGCHFWSDSWSTSGT